LSKIFFVIDRHSLFFGHHPSVVVVAISHQIDSAINHVLWTTGVPPPRLVSIQKALDPFSISDALPLTCLLAFFHH
jgi:hypothetical protein